MRTKNPISDQFVIIFVLKNLIWKSILNRFMISVSYGSVQFVISVLKKGNLKFIFSAQFVIMFVIQNVIWKIILNHFMITWTHPSAQFVITVVQERELWKYILNHTKITRFLKILILTSWRILEVSVFSTFLK